MPLLRALLPPGHHAQPLPTVHLPCRKGITITLWEPPTTPKSVNEPSTEPGIIHNPRIAKGQATSVDTQTPCKIWAWEQPVTAPGEHLHLMREPSLEAEKMNLSSGEMTRQVTGSWCPRSTRILAGSGGSTCRKSTMSAGLPRTLP